MAFKAGSRGGVRVANLFRHIHRFAIIAVSDIVSLAVIPDVPARRRGNPGTRSEVKIAAAIAVHRRPGLFYIVCGVCGHRPVVAVGADLGVDVEVIEQDKLARERVKVGRHLFAEERQAGIAVPLRHVAEYLVIGAVFFYYVEYMLDRRKKSGDILLICNGITSVRRVAIYLRSVRAEFFA